MEAKKRFRLVGGEVEIVLYDIEKELAELFFEDIYKEGLRLEKIFNFFDPKSELSLLNKSKAGRVSKELAEVMVKAVEYGEATKGVYDVSKGKVILARKKQTPLPTISCSYKDIEIKKNNITFLHPDVCVDLGSIAKGYIGDKLLAYIKSLGIESAFVNARGDMAMFGRHIEVVEIQHPRSEEGVAPIVLENKAIATSGDYYQYYGDKKECHIVGETDLISVTIIADSLMEADVLATCAFLLGEKRAEEFLRERNITSMLFNTKSEKKHINYVSESEVSI